MESSSLLEMTVSPLGLKSKQLILSEFSRKTLATRKLRSTLSVSFIPPPGRAAPRAAAAALRGAGRGSGRRREQSGRASRGGGDRQRAGRGGGPGRAAPSGSARPAQAAERRLLLIVSAILLLREQQGGGARGTLGRWEGGAPRARPLQGVGGARRGGGACARPAGMGEGGPCLAAMLSVAWQEGLPCPGPRWLPASLPLAGPEVGRGDRRAGRLRRGRHYPLSRAPAGWGEGGLRA